jgi:hypothetical protein
VGPPAITTLSFFNLRSRYVAFLGPYRRLVCLNANSKESKLKFGRVPKAVSGIYAYPSFRKQKCITRVAIEMHSPLDKQNTIHRDAIDPGLSLDTSLIWKPLCLLMAKRLQASAHGEYGACSSLESPFYMSWGWARVT